MMSVNTPNDDNAIEVMTDRLESFGQRPAICWRDQIVSYTEFMVDVGQWRVRLGEMGIGQGSVCGFLGDYSPQTSALIFAGMQTGVILAPFTQAAEAELDRAAGICGLEHLFRFDENDNWTVEKFVPTAAVDLIDRFRKTNRAGLVFFTSGSTGQPKGILHDAEKVMRKFLIERRGWRTILFLMMDHFGGFNTLLGAFAYGGTAICPSGRSPGQICRLIEAHKANLLPTTPTFINMLLNSPETEKYDLSSMELITYGTELMTSSALRKLEKYFPAAQLKQTYGLSELGVLRSRSSQDGSTWVELGGQGFETKILDGVLWVKSESNMVGYLNEGNPFDEDGWFCTGDEVEQKGGYVRFLGRKNEVINVGGQKVSPSEVESVLQEADNVKDATAYAVSHRVLGQVVNAQVSLVEQEDRQAMSLRLRRYCLEKLARHKVPMRFILVDEETQRSARFKKVRNIDQETAS
jgi:long-chain acyl-CoA synthetase